MNSLNDFYVGDWKREKILGTGGFGTVVLWINTKSNEELALKECRWGHDAAMTPKHKQRWKLEVDIMRRLDHPNVVKAVDVPTELDVPGSSLPIMAMEYCKGGDLRKMLNKPENSCGLPEKQVRLLLRHVVSAVEYLHCMRIIHRDLKPENIVLQEKDGKMLYKLIDLGYAKELDQGSLCTSFVGTLQYLAPELFLSQTYTSSVDFWSLGLLVHEVITGQRPFLPNMSPAQWIPVVRHKTSLDIRAYLNDEGKVQFSKELSHTNQIAGSYKVDIEEWLRMLLEFEPQVRGSKKQVVFSFFKELIDRSVVEVLCLDTCQIYSYAVDASTNLQMLSQNLYKDTGIPIESQLLLLPKGLPPDLSKTALQCWTNPEEEDNITFLFNASALSLAPPFRITIPPLVEIIMRYPHDEISYEAQKNAWREAIFLCQKQQELHRRLTSAYKASLLHLLRKNTTLNKLAAKLKNQRDSLFSKFDFFKICLQQDLIKLDSLVKDKKSDYKSKWNMENFEGMKKLSDEVDNLERQSLQLNSKTVEPQKSPFARSKNAEFLEETYVNIVNMYGQLRRRSRDEKKIRNNNAEIVRQLCDSLQKQEKVFNEIYQSLKSIDEIKKEIEKLTPSLDVLLADVCRVEQGLIQAQMERQEDIWNLYKELNDKLESKNNGKDGPMSKSFDAVFLNRQFNLREKLNETTSPLVNSMTSSVASAELELSNSLMGVDLNSLQSLGSILQHHTLDSRRIRNDNETLRNELDSMLTILNETSALFDD